MYLQLLYERWYTIQKPGFDLSDSTNYMRGKEEGLKNFYEAKLRGIHLLGLHLEGRWGPLKCERMRTRRVGSNVNASIRL